MSNKSSYIGRFAPTPSGPLHFGSMVAAVGSYLRAKQLGGQWLVRIEDIDPPREVAGAADQILRQLEYFGLGWDGVVAYQSERTEAYIAALTKLRDDGLLYACNCTRKQISERAQLGSYGAVYDGRCRTHHANAQQPHALRVVTHNQPIAFNDLILGHYEQQLESQFGDFVVRRADLLFAYQLAVVVDDAAQCITEIVRGSDLLGNTPRQIYLQQCLSLPTPTYAHLPIALNASGQKLSKQNKAMAVQSSRPQELLLDVLKFLNLHPPTDLVESSLSDMLLWGAQNMVIKQIPTHNIVVSDY